MFLKYFEVTVEWHPTPGMPGGLHYELVDGVFQKPHTQETCWVEQQLDDSSAGCGAADQKKGQAVWIWFRQVG